VIFSFIYAHAIFLFKDSAVHEQKLNFHRAQIAELNRRIKADKKYIKKYIKLIFIINIYYIYKTHYLSQIDKCHSLSQAFLVSTERGGFPSHANIMQPPGNNNNNLLASQSQKQLLEQPIRSQVLPPPFPASLRSIKNLNLKHKNPVMR
jgi:hypothetical protein